MKEMISSRPLSLRVIKVRWAVRGIAALVYVDLVWGQEERRTPRAGVRNVEVITALLGRKLSARLSGDPVAED